jgi:hypothetical protein
MAMALAGQKVAMGKAPRGRPSGVVVLLEESRESLVVALEYRETEGAIEVVAAEAMAPVKRTGYDVDHEGWFETIHKATLVVTGRADESTPIEIAPDKRPAKTGKGRAVEGREPDRGSRGRPPKRPKPPGSPKAPKRPKS